MCIANISNKVSAQVSAQSTSNVPVLVLPWMLKHGVDTITIGNQLCAKSGLFVQTVAYRFAAVRPEFPGSFNVTTITRSTDNSGGANNVDVSGTTDQLWVQIILMGKTTDGAVGGAFSTIQAETPGRSKLIVNQRFQLEPTLNSGESAYLPLGNPIPALGLSSLMFAISLFGVGGTITCQPAWRTMEINPESPGSWTDLGSSFSTTTDQENNFGSLSVSPGAVLYAQPGLKILSSSGVGRGTAVVQVAAKF